MSEIVIKDYYGKMIGRIEEQPNGDKVVRDYYGMIKGYYRKSQNITVDYYGKLVAQGDVASSLLYR